MVAILTTSTITETSVFKFRTIVASSWYTIFLALQHHHLEKRRRRRRRSGPSILYYAEGNAYTNNSQQLQKKLYDPLYLNMFCLRYCMMLIGVVWQDECSLFMGVTLQYRIGSGGGLPAVAAVQQQDLVGQVVAGPILKLLRTI